LANQADGTTVLIREWFAGDARMNPTPFMNGSRMVPEWERNHSHPIRGESMLESGSEASYHVIGVRRALCNFGLNKPSSSFRWIGFFQGERPVLALANDIIHGFEPPHCPECHPGSSLSSLRNRLPALLMGASASSSMR